MLYSAATTLGSTAGCFVLYTIAGKAAKRFSGGGSAKRKSSEASACSGGTGCWP